MHQILLNLLCEFKASVCCLAKNRKYELIFVNDIFISNIINCVHSRYEYSALQHIPTNFDINVKKETMSHERFTLYE